MHGVKRVKCINGKFEYLSPRVYTGDYTKAKGWTDIRYIEIKFSDIYSAKMVYDKGKNVHSIGSLHGGHDIWFNSSFIYGTTIMGKTIIDEKVIFGDVAGKTEQRQHFYFKGNRPYIGRVDNPTGIQFAYNVGPLLLDGGEIVVGFRNDDEKFQNDVIGGADTRTAVGLTDDSLILLFVDGRGLLDRGLTQLEMAILFKEWGCHKAINLDGGGSSTIYTLNSTIKDAIGMKSNYHICDTRGGVSLRAVSHGVGLRFNIENTFAPPAPPVIIPEPAIPDIDGLNRVMVRGKILQSPGIVVEGRTYVPLREVGDALGLRIGYNAGTNTASLD